MIRSEIILVCDKCKMETVDVSDRIDINPEYYAIGVSIHTINEDGWTVDFDSEKCKCPNCN